MATGGLNWLQAFEPLSRALPGRRRSTTAATAAASARGDGSGWPTAPTTPPRCSRCSASTRPSPSATRWADRSPRCSGVATPTRSPAWCCAPPPRRFRTGGRERARDGHGRCRPSPGRSGRRRSLLRIPLSPVAAAGSRSASAYRPRSLAGWAGGRAASQRSTPHGLEARRRARQLRRPAVADPRSTSRPPCWSRPRTAPSDPRSSSALLAIPGVGSARWPPTTSSRRARRSAGSSRTSASASPTARRPTRRPVASVAWPGARRDRAQVTPDDDALTRSRRVTRGAPARTCSSFRDRACRPERKGNRCTSPTRPSRKRCARSCAATSPS